MRDWLATVQNIHLHRAIDVREMKNDMMTRWALCHRDKKNENWRFLLHPHERHQWIQGQQWWWTMIMMMIWIMAWWWRRCRGKQWQYEYNKWVHYSDRIYSRDEIKKRVKYWVPECLPCPPRLVYLVAAAYKLLGVGPTPGVSDCSSIRLVRKWRQFQHERAPSALYASLRAGDSGSR